MIAVAVFQMTLTTAKHHLGLGNPMEIKSVVWETRTITQMVDRECGTVTDDRGAVGV